MKFKVKIIAEIDFEISQRVSEKAGPGFPNEFAQSYEFGYRIGVKKDIAMVKEVFRQQFGSEVTVSDPLLTFDFTQE